MRREAGGPYRSLPLRVPATGYGEHVSDPSPLASDADADENERSLARLTLVWGMLDRLEVGPSGRLEGLSACERDWLGRILISGQSGLELRLALGVALSLLETSPRPMVTNSIDPGLTSALVRCHARRYSRRSG